MSSTTSSPSILTPLTASISSLPATPFISIDQIIMAAETITHIVLFKYRSDITGSDLEDHFKYFMSLKTRSLHPQTGSPLIKMLRAGKNTSWEPFSKGTTHAFILEFASQDDLDYYLTAEPVHMQFSRDAKPLIEDSLVVDIKDGVDFGAKTDHPLLKEKEGLWIGSCHCEAVRWTARLESAEHVLCHCETCRKLGGGPYSCNQIIPKDELKIVSGNENIGEYKYKGASGKFVHCYFCKTCTSHIYHHQEFMPEKVIVRTLLLEGGNKMPATGEIFAAGKLHWVKELRDIKMFCANKVL